MILKNIKTLFLILTTMILSITALFAQPLNKNLSILKLDNYIVKAQCSQVIKDPYQVKCYNYDIKKPSINLFKINKEFVNEKIKKRLSFKEDKRIPEEYQNKLICYKHSGFDRGHMAPDRFFDFNLTILKTTYLTSNIIPEYPIVNRVVISKIERLINDKIQKYNIMYIIVIAFFDKNQYLKNDINCGKIPNKILYIIKAPKYSWYYLIPNLPKEELIKKYQDYKNIENYRIYSVKILRILSYHKIYIIKQRFKNVREIKSTSNSNN